MLEIKTNDADTAAKIIVVGVGGAGNNAVNRCFIALYKTSYPTIKYGKRYIRKAYGSGSFKNKQIINKNVARTIR